MAPLHSALCNVSAMHHKAAGVHFSHVKSQIWPVTVISHTLCGCAWAAPALGAVGAALA